MVVSVVVLSGVVTLSVVILGVVFIGVVFSGVNKSCPAVLVDVDKIEVDTVLVVVGAVNVDTSGAPLVVVNKVEVDTVFVVVDDNILGVPFVVDDKI